MLLSLPKQFPLFILASVCFSSVSNFRPDTRGAMVLTFFRLTCSVVLRGGRNTAKKYHWHVLTVIHPHRVCPHSQRVCFPSLHCSGSRLLCQELSDAGPGLHALPTSRSGSGSRVLHKGAELVGPAFCARPRSSSGDQVLGEHSRPQLKAATYCLPCPSCSVF